MKIEKTTIAGCRLYSVDFAWFRHGAAVTLAPFCIIVGPMERVGLQLLMHEVGHLLQYRRWGFFRYWFHIAPVSFISAIRSTIRSPHRATWTEWSANLLAFHHYKCPSDWDMRYYPITDRYHTRKTPKFVLRLEDEFRSKKSDERDEA